MGRQPRRLPADGRHPGRSELTIAPRRHPGATSRRAFLERTATAGLAALLGCRRDAPLAWDTASGSLVEPSTGALLCPDPLAGGTFLGEVPWREQPSRPFHEKVSTGWDARLVFDLREVAAAGYTTVPNEQFYIRTERPDRLDTPPERWVISVDGLVAAPVEIHLDDLTARETDQGPVLLECAGNSANSAFGLLSTASWGGVRLADLLDELVDVDPGAVAVRVEGFDEHSTPSAGGHSTPGAAWVVPLAQLVDAGAFLATTMNGAPLPDDHGAPVRLVVPGWYGCACIKWVTRLTLVGPDEPATSQMEEFAGRTHQSGVPRLAADYAAPAMELSAVAARVERWRLDGAVTYRIVGVLWGGSQTTDRLALRLGKDQAPVQCCNHTQSRTWTVWSHRWDAPAGRSVVVGCFVDADLPQIRLDMGYYDREIAIPTED